jgi:hypothetical protein
MLYPMTSETSPDASDPKWGDVVRLQVNIAPSVARALEFGAEMYGISVTEAVRRAVVLLHAMGEAELNGGYLAIVDNIENPTIAQRVDLGI